MELQVQWVHQDILQVEVVEVQEMFQDHQQYLEVPVVAEMVKEMQQQAMQEQLILVVVEEEMVITYQVRPQVLLVVLV